MDKGAIFLQGGAWPPRPRRGKILLDNGGNPGKIVIKRGARRPSVIAASLPRSKRPAMLIPCSRAQAMFADPGIRLDRHTPGFMVWDEHGGTFVLRVEELAATEVAAGEPETGIILEIPLSPGRGSFAAWKSSPPSNNSPWPRPRARNCWRRPSWRPVTCRGRTCSSLPKSRTWRSKSAGRPWNWRSPASSRPGGSPARKPTWSFTSPRPPWPGWWPWCSAWPGAEAKALARPEPAPGPRASPGHAGGV